MVLLLFPVSSGLAAAFKVVDDSGVSEDLDK